MISKTSFVGLEDIVAGSRKEQFVAEKVREFFEELGIETHVFEFEALSWVEDYVEVKIGGLKLRSVSMPYTLSDDVEGKVFYAGDRMLEEDWASLDLSGKIALVKLYEKVDEAEWQYLQAVRFGAEAVVFMDIYPGRVRRMVLTLNTDYRFKEGTPPPVPAVSVSFEDGLRILRLAEEGKKMSIRVETRVDHQARSRVVYAGNLSGPVFSAHIDKWLSGFRDNVLGVGVVFYLAEKFREKAGYILFGSEESGAPGFSPWYWIWGSRSFAEFLEKRGLLDEFGVLLNVDTLGGRNLRISASTPDVQAWLSRLLGDQVTVCPDHVIFDSFSFTMKGVPSTTTHTFPEVIPVYHTEVDTADTVDWVGVENALRVLERVSSEIISHGLQAFSYEELINSIIRKVERVSFLPSARQALEFLGKLKVNDEREARMVRSTLTRPMFWGRYDRIFADSVAFYPLYTDSIDDLILVFDILSGVRNPSDIVRIRGVRRIAGFEETLGGVEPVFYGRTFTSPQFLHQIYSVLEKVVQDDINELINRLRMLKI